MTDALAHRNLGAELRPQIVEAGLEHIYRIDKSVLPFLVRHELVGMKVNEKALPRLSAKFEAEYTRACARLADIAGHPVNPEAHEEVSDVLFKELGITPTKPTKTGFYTTQKKYLQARQKEHEAVGLVIHARHMTKLKSTYTDRLPSLLRDGRYHADWKYTRTASGRMAEEIILLIPKHSPFATYVRNVFIPDEGQILVSCDLSQIEMRVMAHESRDPIFMRAYRTGVDMHAQTAWELLGAPKKAEQQDESKHRLPAKILNFGVLMGMTEYGVYEQLQASGQSHWQVEELTDTMREQGFKSTTEFRREWFALYAGVGAWVEQKKAEGRRRGYVRDMWGRRIEVSGIWSTNSRIRAEFERKAHAIPIQSGAIGIAKRWVSRVEKFVLRKHRGKVEPFVWVHDDITLRVNEDQAQEVQGQVLALVPDDLCVPTTADAKTGYAWGNLH